MFGAAQAASALSSELVPRDANDTPLTGPVSSRSTLPVRARIQCVLDVTAAPTLSINPEPGAAGGRAEELRAA